MANYFKALNEAFDNKYGLNKVVESKRNLKEAKDDIFSMTLSEYADSQGVDEKEAESWVTLHPEKTISKIYFSEDEESPYTGVVYTDGTISVVGLRYDDDVKDFSTMRKVLLGGSEGEDKVYYPNGVECKDNSVDMDKALDYQYGTDRDKDNSKYTAEEKQRALNYWIWKADSLNKEPIEEAAEECLQQQKSINEDGAEDFLNELSDTIRKDVWDVVFDDVADAIDDVDNLPDYLPMTSEEANNQLLDAVRKLAEAAFIRYCVYMRDIQVDESIVKKVTQPIRDAADTVRDVLNIPDKNTKLDEDKGSLDNEIDRYQRWVDFDMSRYGKISERTQQMVNKAGYQILKDDHGDYEVAAGHFE